MDHHLDDSLNLESAMGVDFGQPGDVIVSQSGVSLEDGSPHEQEIPMDFDNIEEQPMLIETNGEEIIVPELIGDQFSLHDYQMIDNNHSSETNIILDPKPTIASNSETMGDFQIDPQTQEITFQQKIVEIKPSAPQHRPVPNKKTEPVVLASMPRQVAIAPKPPQKAGFKVAQVPKTTFSSKQYAIAPKPSSAVTSKPVSLMKKVSISSLTQENIKGNVLGQMGKQIIMMPANVGPQKIKLISATGGAVPNIQYIRTNSDQAQLIPSKNIAGVQTVKPVVAKLIPVQGQQNMDTSNQPAVITKVFQTNNSAPGQTRVVTMQQKTVPISIRDKMFISSPTKQVISGNKGQEFTTVSSPTKPTVNISKSQDIFAIKTTSKLVPATSLSQVTTTKKVLITANPKQNVVLKATAPQTIQVSKESTVNTAGQRSQIHQVNIPGKGVQYIRLVTPPPIKSVSTVTPTTIANPTPKAFVLTDRKGNVIQMREINDKLTSHQPPPLVVTGKNTVKKVPIPPQKLVRIAPVSSKSQPVTQQTSTRPSQSLLAPLPPAENAIVFTKIESSDHETESVTEFITCPQRPEDNVDNKAALRALIEDTVGSPADMEHNYMISPVEIEVDMQPHESSLENENMADQTDSSAKSDEHPLIVIPSQFAKQESGHNTENGDAQKFNSLVDIEIENLDSINEPMGSPTNLSDSEMVPTEFGLRPRKPCNCTKSQCLKLYCDCFANGEFCNNCNCNNCLNNLDNEELRQKAIRGCLDRNPNAFRPKIGKAKYGGPEIVRRHNKGCNCKRSGCLKNYCECYEAKIACSAICKCVGCRNVEETLERGRRAARPPSPPAALSALSALVAHTPRAPHASPAAHPLAAPLKQPCSFITNDVIEAVCQCLLASAVEGGEEGAGDGGSCGMTRVIEEFSRCLQDIISAAQHASLNDEGNA